MSFQKTAYIWLCMQACWLDIIPFHIIFNHPFQVNNFSLICMCTWFHRIFYVHHLRLWVTNMSCWTQQIWDEHIFFFTDLSSSFLVACILHSCSFISTYQLLVLYLFSLMQRIILFASPVPKQVFLHLLHINIKSTSSFQISLVQLMGEY